MRVPFIYWFIVIICAGVTYMVSYVGFVMGDVVILSLSGLSWLVVIYMFFICFKKVNEDVKE